jgi:hypothetical protein
MARYLKVVFTTLILLMVVFALLADTPWIKNLFQGLDLAVYIAFCESYWLVYCNLYRPGIQDKDRNVAEVSARSASLGPGRSFGGTQAT